MAEVVVEWNSTDDVVQWVVLSEPDKYLFKDGEEVKSFLNGTWQVVGSSPVTKSMFDAYGIENLSTLTAAALQELRTDSPNVFVWIDQEGEAPSREIDATAIPLPQLLVSTEDIEFEELENMTLTASLTGSSDIRVVLSGDSGTTWTADLANATDVKASGFTVQEANALTKEELASLLPSDKVRFAFYLEQGSFSDPAEIHSLSINEKQYTITPDASSLSVLYELLESKKPVLYASRDDGTNWVEVNADQINSLQSLPEGDQLRVKVALADGQELYGLSYSWI